MNTILASLCVGALASCAPSSGPADVPGKPAISCSLEGAQHVAGNADADALCERFTKQFNRGFAEGAGSADGVDYAIRIEIGQRGSLQAQITSESVGGKKKAYPVVAVDVTDRALTPDDIDQLADSVARYLAGQ